ncbi:MAG TPA: TIGR00730 family Rossman fold protein, partial [Tepidisphaeraceae bacterium]|nr:TIGR00730 family Rossman fold protein [Tepidisphaeraceae bacterium]
VYFEAARELGTAIAANHWSLVYGGNALGLMKAVADAARAAGGRVVGVTPRRWVDDCTHDPDCHELIVTDDMRQRKGHMEARGDAFVALPGGLGTFEELFEVIVGRSLGYHAKPIVVLNVGGYFAPLLAMVEHGIDGGFIRPSARQLYHVSPTVPNAIAHLKAPHPVRRPDADARSSARE